MKFSTVALSLPLIAMVQAGISSPTYYKPEHTEEIGVETVDYEFALGVREKCDEDTIYLAYEVDDGQLERNDKKVDCNCKSEPVVYPTPRPSKTYWDGGDDNDECDEDCDDEDKKKGHKQYKRGEVEEPCETSDCDFCTIEKSFCQDQFTLCEGVLKDQRSAIGSIVANHQFQFDNPIQKDALHTCGWSIVEKDCVKLLALDGCTDFWECPVDDCDTYKLYDSSIDDKCKEIEIIVILFEEEEEEKKKHKSW
ncbi:hypothetical protein MG5_02052 [Candida albicans P57072]|uniref:Cell wall mannoprotein PIR1-like C-terminal domain-containing protein n=3 Tax=Candida albicans TaxID=5476 RepID=Q59Q33_CANAL|nr:uncharacterized protein CAALFM_C206550WA [Candida albicans SC5314]KAF6063606.1 hypothetical protein FOB64_005238 [Candida albicans]KGQ89190.1 hypothetical protein MEO_02052 [Candida albicans P94015]KGR00259.1 hypothetical protein MG1_02084 [Candida albicans GC75]KGR12404.1 hypothetical protein MG5_02052 [Candida albicans P57072]KGR13639.1 hypothetical protein MG3_02069 [Candida albicans P78048]KGR20999.1 hypothetical protein MG9_02068 [Candida albicans P37037]KGT70836.1 hypothetical prote|eukprot:XP_711838.1 hypothetical protein CAALFM_C206550WA [Candida albicans SC5314]